MYLVNFKLLITINVVGAHFNPAVTLGTIVRRKTSVLKGLFYMGAQLAGATLAILLINSSVFPEFTGQNLVIKPASDVSSKKIFFLSRNTFRFCCTNYGVYHDFHSCLRNFRHRFRNCWLRQTKSYFCRRPFYDSPEFGRAET